jgi:hypothetical protein
MGICDVRTKKIELGRSRPVYQGSRWQAEESRTHRSTSKKDREVITGLPVIHDFYMYQSFLFDGNFDSEG